MSEPEAAPAAVELVAMCRDPNQYPASFKADVHPAEVNNYLAAGWMLGEGVNPLDPTYWTRERLLEAVRGQFEAYLAGATDDQLRVMYVARLPDDEDDGDDDQVQLDLDGLTPAVEVAATGPGSGAVLEGDGSGSALPEVVEPATEQEAPATETETETRAPGPGDADGDGHAREDMTSAQLRDAITAAGGEYLARDDKPTLQVKLADALAAKAAAEAAASQEQ